MEITQFYVGESLNAYDEEPAGIEDVVSETNAANMCSQDKKELIPEQA